MTCDDPKKSEEEEARAELEKMDDDAVIDMANMLELLAKDHPASPAPILKIVKKKPIQKPKK